MWRQRICMVVLGVAIGWMANEAFTPDKRPRPVLSIVSRVARLALWWFALQEEPQQCPAHHDGVGPDGYAVVDHGGAL
jgi:hypothetical protein